MNFDEIKSQWARQDEKLDRILQLSASAIREIRLSGTRTRLRSLRLGVVFELVVTLMAVVWLGDFIAGHLREPRFLLPAVLVDICLIAFMGVCVRQLAVIGSLDYGRPVVAVQKELEKLRILRIRTTMWTITLSFVLWFPLLIVLLKGLLGVDAWMILGAVSDRQASFFAWIAANVVFGMGVAFLLMWLAKRYAPRFEGPPFINGLLDAFAGRSLTEALRSLDSIVGFEGDLEMDSNLSMR